ncbi:SRC kinase signaling inhibitor 1 isoform X5 [Takifugu rubripes]|uniref:SRC kinase signaling inhibitor 1 isoform X5 n=1 Tax=Takifugu rubripes TaxID=31033 RepID=UPI0011453B07|nr:SRC kinase signaling inhibitor 1-like isoform X5 [Takifugu rubripes]
MKDVDRSKDHKRKGGSARSGTEKTSYCVSQGGERHTLTANTRACFPQQDPERGGGHLISRDDLEYPREYRTLGNSGRRFSNVGLVHTSEHRHTVTAAQSLEALTNLHKADMERKRDAFMDHLKSKYQQQQQQQLQHPHHSPHHTPPSPSPSHASMRGTSDRSVREQQQPNYWSFKSRSPRHSQSTQSGLADQAAKLSFASAESLETMSEADVPVGFNRMNRLRQSLPLSRSASQNKLRSPDEYSGVLFLQYGDETRRVHITHELSSLDTLHALIVHMFPQKLTAGMLKSPNTAILIKDEARNVFYELEDVRDIQDRSVIKIYRKEPIYASYPAAAHLANGDLRREMVYSSRDSSPTRRLNTLPSSSGSASSGSPSRSRLSYSGGRPPSFASPHSQLEQPRHPHHPSAGHGVDAALSPSPSAILERRDVKPDEEVSAKNLALMKNEGLYADPYSLMHEGRLSIASTQSLATIGDPFNFPVSTGLYRRGSVRSLSTYSAAALQGDLEDSLYKPGSSLYSDTYSSATLGMGFRMPPSSPQKITDMHMRDRDSYSSSPSRASPVRQTFRKDSTSSSVFVESPKSRPSSGSEPLCLTAGPGEGGRTTSVFGSSMSAQDSDSSRDHRLERMEAMEKQIASLTGLVQSVLTRAPDSDSTCGLLRLCMMAGCPPDQGTEFSRPLPFSSSEKTETNSDGSATAAGRLKQKAHTPSAPLALMPPPPSNAAHVNSINHLQMQLHLSGLKKNATDLRKQLTQLRKTQLDNQDSVRSLLKRTEAELNVRVTDALRKQEDPLQRQRLLVEEERLKYLNEEELIIQQLHDLEKSVEEIQKESSVNHKLLSVQELEEKTNVLRKLGETLTELKNQFPGLQSKMRVVLRVEVEAVKFLKEEPHRLDALLKRCKTISDTLNTMRKQANEDFDIPTSPPLAINDLGGSNSLSNWSPHSSLSRGHRVQSGQHKDNHPAVPHKGKALEELERRTAADKALSVEVRLAAERDWEEKRASLTQYSAQDINRLLEETQAELMKAIPDLDFAAKQIKPSTNAPSTQPPQSGTGTPEHRVSKPQHKLPGGKEGGSRRSSDELTVPRYRTEKPSKSPPPPPPRRSFPSSPGLTSRSGEPLIPGKSIKKTESEETEGQKPHIKLRRAVSESPRPASTPPTLASEDREEREVEKKAADLERKASGDIRRVTYKRLDSLEETICELERTLIEISVPPPAGQRHTDPPSKGSPVHMSHGQTSGTRKPPVPPKPSSLDPASTQGGNILSVGKVLHSSAASKLKHLQQNNTDKMKSGKKEDFQSIQGQQQALRTSSSGSIEPFKTGYFSGRVPRTAAALAPGLRKYPHGGVVSLTTSSSQAKALLASLSASGLTTEALLLSSTLRYHRLLREQRASSVPLPSSQSSSPTPPASSSSSSCSSSPTTLTPSLSPSSPSPLNSLTYSSAFVNGSACSIDSSILSNGKDEAGNKDLTRGNVE